jgi:hypothetical protein
VFRLVVQGSLKGESYLTPPLPPKYVKSRRKKTGERTKQEENHQPNSKTISIQTNKPE